GAEGGGGAGRLVPFGSPPQPEPGWQPDRRCWRAPPGRLTTLDRPGYLVPESVWHRTERGAGPPRRPPSARVDLPLRQPGRRGDEEEASGRAGPVFDVIRRLGPASRIV